VEKNDGTINPSPSAIHGRRLLTGEQKTHNRTKCDDLCHGVQWCEYFLKDIAVISAVNLALTQPPIANSAVNIGVVLPKRIDVNILWLSRITFMPM
jgi:hypothetical protein